MPSNKHNNDETIYNLIPKPEINPPKMAIYQSKFKEMVIDESVKPKKDHRTMGYAKEPVPKPNEFLKAHMREPQLPEPKEFKRDDRRKAPLPDPKTDQPKLGLKTNKNFVSQNAVDAIMAVTKKPERNLVDTRKGNKFNLDASGLAPIYIKKKDFGSVPSYVIKRKEEMTKAQEDYDNFVSEYFKKGALRTMSIDEREAILDGLKKSWDEIHHEYQLLSVMIDTIPKRQKKERLELEMKRLEKDIDLLDRHQVIYIAD